jgi:4-carboxymuconolactone decarboxylase
MRKFGLFAALAWFVWPTLCVAAADRVTPQPHGDQGCLPRASDGFPEPSLAEKRAAGRKVMLEMYDQKWVDMTWSPSGTMAVAPDLGGISADNIMAGLWARCGLTRRERSLVNLGILIARRSNGQMAEHFRNGLRNGLSKRELEEVIYQAAGYAGLPEAANARAVLMEVLGEPKDN